METQAETTREAIIRAANTIVGREGAARLTIEAVARESGLSKGGVLYHFRSKDALVAGMIAALIDEFEADMDRHLARERPGAGSWLRAYVRASATPEALPDDGYASLLAAIGTNPSLLEPLRARYAAWQARLEGDGLQAATATLVRLAADGLWLADLFGLATPSGRLRAELIDTLLELAKGDGG